MTYTEFINKYNGKETNYDGAYGVQCVDLIKAYFEKVFGIPQNSFGNGHAYYDNFETSKYANVRKHFTRIEYSSGMNPQKGDVVVWSGKLNGGDGHVAIASGEGTTTYFYSYDQNWEEIACTKVKHLNYNYVSGFLRPKDQSKITGGSTSGGSSSGGTTTVRRFANSVVWKNGSTSETVFKLNDLTEKIGSLSAYESAKCFGKSGKAFIVQYNLNGTNKHKVGFVGYAGGVTNAPTESKIYKNNSTSETVYADTAKNTVVGSLDANETCRCITKTDNMYLVVYKVNGTTKEKCGFVSYSGGC